MTTRTYGEKYEATKDLDIAEIAKLVRADIKAAVKASAIPAADYRVTISRYAGGQSMTVRVLKPSFPVLNRQGFQLTDDWRSQTDPSEQCERLSNQRDEKGYFLNVDFNSPAARSVEAALEALMGAYNYDHSDAQSDYSNTRFYTHIYIESDYETLVRDLYAPCGHSDCRDDVEMAGWCRAQKAVA